MDAYSLLIKLFDDIYSIRRRYPMIVSHLKYLKRNINDESAQKIELDRFRSWMLTNPNILDRQLANTIYKTKTTFCFDNVLKLASKDVIDTFWNNLANLEMTIFASGRPKENIVSIDGASAGSSKNGGGGADAALAIIESNPMFSELLGNIKSKFTANSDPVDFVELMKSKDVKKIMKSLSAGIASGKYNISELKTTVTSIVDSVKDELDENTLNTVNDAVSIISSAEKGESINVNKLFDMVHNFKDMLTTDNTLDTATADLLTSALENCQLTNNDSKKD